METQIIGSTSDRQIEEEAAKERAAGRALPGGMLQTGEEIDGYVIEERLSAAGGEAEVYLCAKGGERFALKYYYAKKPNLGVIKKVKAFSHPGIIGLTGYGEYKDRFYAVLEYAAGGSLDEKLPDGSWKYLPVGEEEALRITGETINALEACHKAGIIHRDIKPGNLFYKHVTNLPDGKPKGSGILVGDFGIASVFEADAGMSKRLTETGARTEGYAAPEAYSGVIGPELDYYSLGVTLWALLTGKEPFVNEKGYALYSGQIMLDAMQGKTADNLLSRQPKLSGRMQKLIRGLLTVRHDKRWKHGDVARFLAGEEVEVFTETRSLPVVGIGGESCASYREIAAAIVKHPREGKQFVFRGKLPAYLIKIDQKLADRLLDIIDAYSAEGREDEGLVHVAYSLCPNMPFPVEHGLSVGSLEEMFSILETDPQAILPYLRDGKKGFYAYLEAAGLGEEGKKVRELVSSTVGNIRAVSRIIVAFRGNVITPFQDGINNGLRLASIEDLLALPDYLKERALIFIERNYGLLPAWIENITGKNMDAWVKKLDDQKEARGRWGAWKYFTLFLEGKTADFYNRFSVGEGAGKKYGLKYLSGEEAMPAVWEGIAAAQSNTFWVTQNGKCGVIKRDGSVVIPLEYEDINNWDVERGLFLTYNKKPETEFKIISLEGKTVYSGPDRLYYHWLPGNPYAVVSDNKKKLFNRDFELIREAGEYLAPYTVNDAIYIWVKDPGRAYILGTDLALVKELPYGDFSRGTPSAPAVNKENAWGLARADGTELVPCKYRKAQFSLTYCLFGSGTKYTLYEVPLTVDRAEALFTAETGGDALRLKDKGGETLLEAKYAVGFAEGHNDKGHSLTPFVFTDRLYIFDGSALLAYNLKTKQKEPRGKLAGGEAELLVRFADVEKLVEIAGDLRRNKDHTGVNRIVDAGWKKFYGLGYWGNCKTVLELIQKEHTEGLEHGYDFYRYYTGETFFQREDFKNALQCYEEALTLNPTGCNAENDSYYANCAGAYLKLNNYKKTVEYCDKALAINPNTWRVHSCKGYALYELKKYTEALACFALWIENEKCAAAYTARGSCYKALGMNDKADEDYAEAKRLRGKAPSSAAAPAGAQKFCEKCGAKLAPGERFCSGCGTKAAGAPAAASRAAPKAKVCVKCGAKLLPGEKFCSKCGTKTGG
jgi:tetratricopeptide (TPR) repeat protein